MSEQTPEVFLFVDGPFGIDFQCPMMIDGRQYDTVRHYCVEKKVQLLRPSVPPIPNGLSPLELRAYSVDAWVNSTSVQQDAWMAIARDVMMRASLAKFADNLKLRAQLLLTDDKILAYADDSDLRWGTGVGIDHPDAEHPDRWPGDNWAGNVLTALREHLTVMNCGASQGVCSKVL